MSLMQLNTGGLVTCELRVLINELSEEKDEWRLKFENEQIHAWISKSSKSLYIDKL